MFQLRVIPLEICRHHPMEGAAHSDDGSIPPALHIAVGSLKASRMPQKKSHGAALPYDNLCQSWPGRIGIAVAIGVAYFAAARFGLAFRAKPGGVAVFWPAAGVAIGALVALGPNARLPIAAAVVVATIASKLVVTGNLGLGLTFGLVCAVQTLLTAWLIEHWFGRAFKLGDVAQVLGFLVASAVGAAIAAVGAVAAVSLVLQSTASLLDVWRLWFASCLLGTVTVAPLLVGLGEAARALPPRREMIESGLALAALIVLSLISISLPQSPWATALPVALVFPVLLWITVRCRLVFAAAAVFVVALAVIWSTTFSVGHFGDASIPLEDRILAAQTLVLTGALLTLVLTALFAERRQREATLEQSKDRLQLALDGAALGAFSLDIATGRLDCDERATLMHGHNVPPTTIKEGRRYVHPDDRARIDTAFAGAERNGGAWKAEYRVVNPPDHAHAGETRWIAFEGSVLYSSMGAPVRLLGITRDITHHKQMEQALEERNLQSILANKAGRVGSFAYDVDTEKMQISPGYAAIQGYPEGTAEITRGIWLAGVYPEDVERLNALRSQAFQERQREYNMEYRIVRSGVGVRWIESRSFISYDSDGRAQRVIGVNIDVTERMQTEAQLKDSKARLADA
jgi:PAS domain S-box-containing protein